MDSTKGQAASGVSLTTGRNTTITVRSASMQLLIGGPYTDVRGNEHTYGHTALRVITDEHERVYDFGRYGGERGPTGEGRQRIWVSFKRYIIGENAYGRPTTGFLYNISHEQAEQINAHFASLIAGRATTGNTPREHMTEYRLANDYHALTNNCVTSAMAGARLAIPDLEHNVATHNQGRGMSFTERAAARVAGWPGFIFMPADLQAMLEANTEKPADKVEKFGVRK